MHRIHRGGTWRTKDSKAQSVGLEIEVEIRDCGGKAGAGRLWREGFVAGRLWREAGRSKVHRIHGDADGADQPRAEAAHLEEGREELHTWASEVGVQRDCWGDCNVIAAGLQRDCCGIARSCTPGRARWKCNVIAIWGDCSVIATWDHCNVIAIQGALRQGLAEAGERSGSPT